MKEKVTNENNNENELVLNEGFSESGSEYFLDLCDYILGEIDVYYNCEVEELVETGYSKESLKNLIQMVEDKDFPKRENKDIENILTEIGFKVSKQLSSVPVNISKFTKQILKDYGKETAGLTHEYKVYFNKKSLFKDERTRPIETLYTILHELYHVKQFNNFNHFLNDLPYEKDSLYTMMQDILINIYPEGDFKQMKKELDEYILEMKKRRKNKYGNKPEDEEENDKELDIYSASLIELDANLFAINTLKKYIDKGYFKDTANATEVLFETTAMDIITYCTKAINLSKSIYAKNLKFLSKVKELDKNKALTVNGEEIIPAEGVELLQLFYDVAKNLEMDKFLQRMKDKTEVIKTEFLMNEAFETYKYN